MNLLALLSHAKRFLPIDSILFKGFTVEEEEAIRHLNGYQYGNFYMARELAKLTLALAQEKITEYEEDNDD